MDEGDHMTPATKKDLRVIALFTAIGGLVWLAAAVFAAAWIFGC